MSQDWKVSLEYDVTDNKGTFQYPNDFDECGLQAPEDFSPDGEWYFTDDGRGEYAVTLVDDSLLVETFNWMKFKGRCHLYINSGLSEELERSEGELHLLNNMRGNINDKR